MKSIRIISSIFVGCIFIFSGFVKAVDPAGSAIKFIEYFEAFKLDFLVITAMPLAIILSAAELMLGLNLLALIRMKFTAWLLLIFMSFFTLLTLVLALTNPVSDCGCFGDALKLTNWQTFGKNIILFLPTLVIFLERNKYAVLFRPWTGLVMVSFNFLFACLVSAYCLFHQPILDFRPYKTGTYIPGEMIIPEGAPMDEYQTILVYQKNGVQKEFSDTNFPWQDTTWKWVETRQNLIRKGYEPPIHDFSITRSDGSDITDSVLQDSGYVFLFVAPSLEKSPAAAMSRLNDLALRCLELGFRAYCLTSSPNTMIETFQADFQPAFEICSADETTLKTIIRANPGVLLLREGTILGKWNYRDAPLPSEVGNNMMSYIMRDQQKKDEFRSLVILFLALMVIYMAAYAYQLFFPIKRG